MTSEVRKPKYQFVFDTYWDFNKDGCIDKKDIDLQIGKCCEVKGYKPGSSGHDKIKTALYKIFDGMMEQLDTNKDGRITLEEWRALYKDYPKNCSEQTKWIKLYGDLVFDVCSNEGDDSITLEQYKKVLVFFGINKEDAEITFRRSNDGKSSISKTDFKKLWQQYFGSDKQGHSLSGY